MNPARHTTSTRAAVRASSSASSNASRLGKFLWLITYVKQGAYKKLVKLKIIFLLEKNTFQEHFPQQHKLNTFKAKKI